MLFPVASDPHSRLRVATEIDTKLDTRFEKAMSLSRRWRVSKMIQKDGEMYYTTMKPRTSLSFHNGVIDRIRGGRLISFSFPHGRVWEERATRRTVGAERVAKARRGGGAARTGRESPCPFASDV